MGCCWVNYVARIDSHHGNFFILCPTCGQWGSLFKKSSSSCVRLGIRHRDETRCAITWHPEFTRFSENIYKTVFRIHVARLRKFIHDGSYIVEDYNYTLRCAPNKSPENVNIISIEEIDVTISSH